MEQLSLFDNRERTMPLASRLRPDNLNDYVGQKHLIGKGKILMDGGLSMLHQGGASIDETVAELYRSYEIE